MRSAMQGRLVKEGSAQSVKLEGGRSVTPQIRAIVDAGIPVVAHLGLTPQAIHALGGFKVQGKGIDAQQRLREDAIAVQQCGRIYACFGNGSSKSCQRDYSNVGYPYDWDWCWSSLRRASIGLQ